MTIVSNQDAAQPAAPSTHVHEDVDLRADPFVALRVAFGMLLGEDDFRVLIGQPRGKQMLHTAWLHGRGVVWGLGVTHDPEKQQVVVAPGLAVDGNGRELHLDVPYCASVQQWADEWRATAAADLADGATEEVQAWVVASWTGCLGRPVPALADPCDINRKHTEDSRILEMTSITIRPDRPGWPVPFHRVRALLALEELRADGDQDVRDAIATVEAAQPHVRAGALVREFRRLAARDVTERAPKSEQGDTEPGLFPVREEDAGVVLARLTARVSRQGDCVTAGDVEVDDDVRTALLPTLTIQELTCGRAPSLFGAQSMEDAGGPRLVPGSVTWSRGNSRVTFDVTQPIAEGSQEYGVEVTSLSARGRGWAPSHIDRTYLQQDGTRVVVELDESPAYPTARVVIRGTGMTPLYGQEPRVPFAGVDGGPPGSEFDGHDAVDVQELFRAEREEDEA
jgi:hypothetical protein